MGNNDGERPNNSFDDGIHSRQVVVEARRCGDEFEKLYASLFRHWKQNLSIIKAMAKKLSGQTRNEILNAARFASGGTVSKRFGELEESGFIMRTVPFGGKENDALFRVADEFSLFHLKWMTSSRHRNAKPGHWQSVHGSPSWRAWSGYAFEGICLKHIEEIRHALRIGGVQTEESSWRFVPPKGQREKGAQIDLVIDREDACINLCEMKYSDKPFTIDKRFANDLVRKRSVFQRQTNTRRTLFLTMLSPDGLEPNEYATELIAAELDLESLFRPRPM